MTLPDGPDQYIAEASGESLEWDEIRLNCRNHGGPVSPTDVAARARGLFDLSLMESTCLERDRRAQVDRCDVSCPRAGCCPYGLLCEGLGTRAAPVLRGRKDQPRPIVFSWNARNEGEGVLVLRVFGSARAHSSLAAQNLVRCLSSSTSGGHRPTPLEVVDWEIRGRSASGLSPPSLVGPLTLVLETPLRLVANEHVSGTFDTETFFLRLLERLDALATLYGVSPDGAKEVTQFRNLRSAVQHVKVGRTDLCRRRSVRHSTRGKQDVWLDGLTGTVEILELPEELRLPLALGQVTGVGKSTVFGCGQYEIRFGSDT